MNWYLVIPVVGAVVLLFTAPGDFILIPLAIVAITGAAWILEKVFGPRGKKG